MYDTWLIYLESCYIVLFVLIDVLLLYVIVGNLDTT